MMITEMIMLIIHMIFLILIINDGENDDESSEDTVTALVAFNIILILTYLM